MDIEYLLSLQSFREADGRWLAPVMNILSEMVPYLLFLIPILVFWNAKRETGYWCLFNLGFSDFVNNMVKMTACVYRPWVRDKRIHPWKDALGSATGYSFPSGHTVTAAAVLGSTVIMQRRRKWVSVLMVFLILLVAFSRNYLGVHTPQDVLAGIAEACLVIAFSSWLFRHIRGNERRQDIWTAIGVVVVILSLLWIQFKGYPMDTDAETGELVVDPQSMMKDVFMSLGTMLGFLAGSFWERKRIHFDPSGTVKERIIRSAIGTVVVLAIYLGLRKAMVQMINVKLGSIVSMFLLSFFVTGFYPWCIMKMKEKRGEKM